VTEDGTQESGKFRNHQGILKPVVNFLYFSITLIGVLWAVQVQHMLGLAVFREQYLALVLGVGLVTVFLAVKARKSEADGRGVPWYDWILVALSIGATGQIVLNYPTLIEEIAATTPDRWALGAVSIFLVLEATRRLVGWILIWLALIFIFYAKFSHIMPGVLFAPSTGWARLGAYFYLDTNAILGLPLTVMSTIIIAFILFGRILYAMNADKFLTGAALATMGRYRGGPAKVAVGASSLFGTISGSVVSNVVMDGPITIPMMTNSGYKPHVAAAIEAVASTGGQIMPPVMGITAFLIADWIGIPYTDVIIAALFPAVLYYVALFMQVDLEAAKTGLVGMPADRLPQLWEVMRQGWVFVIPFAILIYTLIGLAWQPARSAMAAVIAALIIGIFNPVTRPSLRKIWIAMVETGQTVLDLLAITAVAGVIIGALQVSGLAFGMSLILVTIAAGSLLLLLLMTAGLSIILGMGMPTAVIYILLAILVAPSLIEFGVPELAAHLFLFYFGMLSMITPPMCIATFAAATIAKCNFWEAGWSGVRLGIVAYVIPFMFVYHPELLLIGGPLDIVLAILSAIVGVAYLAAGFAGYLFRDMNRYTQAIFILSGLFLIPSPTGSRLWLAVNLIGFAAGALAVLRQRQMARSAIA
jgi:TRAP transporter 4TM/12TM fusion protein